MGRRLGWAGALEMRRMLDREPCAPRPLSNVQRQTGAMLPWTGALGWVGAGFDFRAQVAPLFESVGGLAAWKDCSSRHAGRAA